MPSIRVGSTWYRNENELVAPVLGMVLGFLEFDQPLNGSVDVRVVVRCRFERYKLALEQAFLLRREGYFGRRMLT